MCRTRTPGEPLPRIGYCSFTTSGSEGDCDGAPSSDLKGSWPLSEGLASLDECARRCSACAKCNYVSFSEAQRDCSWFHRCDYAHLQSLHRASFRSLHVPKNVSFTPLVLELPEAPQVDFPADEEDERELKKPAPAETSREAAVHLTLGSNARPALSSSSLL